MFGHGENVGAPGIRHGPRRVVDRKPGIIADVGSAEPFRVVLVKLRRIFSNQVNLGKCGRAEQHHRRQEH